MPKLLSRSKHEEFESNSALQIRDKKEKRAENTKKMEPAKFGSCEHCSSGSTVYSSCHCSSYPVPSYCPFLLFDIFLVFFLFSPCNSVYFCSFW